MLRRILSKLSKLELRFSVPVPGLGCGVLGMALPKESVNLGKYASQLLKALEYRGYDSTGAAFLNGD